jgi:hypothetical protein
MFFDTDVDSTVDGDLVVQNGDFNAATVSDTLLRTISFCLLTEYGDYKPEKEFGGAPSNFIGKPNNSHTRDFIRLYLDYALKKQGILDGSNYSMNVVPVGDHEIAIIIKIIEEIGEFASGVSTMENIIAYKYDFNNGTLEAVHSA